MFSDLINSTLKYAVGISETLAPYFGGGVNEAGPAGITNAIGSANSDIILIGFLIFVIFIIGITLGKSRLILSIFSIYIAFILEELFPFQNVLNNSFDIADYWLSIGVLILFYALVMVVLNKSIIKKRFSLNEAPFFAVLSISIIQAGFLTSIIAGMLPDSIIFYLSPLVASYFASQTAQFCWAFITLITFLLANKKKQIEGGR